jgi:two-component system, chemotaxis family, chemotaxis protein CheY
MSSKPLRILLIDDSAEFRRLVGGALEASGLTVVEAVEGYEALWRVRAEGVFDLILADIHMPNLDGITFIREVRKLPEYAEVPIVVVTSDGTRERRQEGKLAGATAWVLKPPDLPALVSSVHAALLRIIKVKDPSTPAAKPQQPLASLEPPPAVRSQRSRAPVRSSLPTARSQAPSGSSRAPVISEPGPLSQRVASLLMEPPPRSKEPEPGEQE